MKKTNKNFNKMLENSNVPKVTIELINNILNDVSNSQKTDREIEKRNIDLLISKEVSRSDS